MNTTQTFPVNELLQALEPMIRQIVREELNNTAQHTSQHTFFTLSPESQLYLDMQDLLQRKTTGNIQLKSHAEVWDE